MYPVPASNIPALPGSAALQRTMMGDPAVYENPTQQQQAMPPGTYASPTPPYGTPAGPAPGAAGQQQRYGHSYPPAGPYDAAAPQQAPFYTIGMSAPPGQGAKPAAAAAGGGGGGFGPAGDVEAQTLERFATRAVRHGFVRKVFGIVSLQLAVTVGFAAVCMYVTPVKRYVRSTPWLFYLSWALAFALLITLSCGRSLRRKYPANMVLLGAFTLAQAFLIGMITSFFNTEVVLMAFVATAAAVVAITIFATQTKFDITNKGTYLVVGAVVLLVTLFIGVFWVSKAVLLVISGFGALLFSAFLLYDIQMLMGGRRYELSPDEYVFAALSIYLDIINIFLFLLSIFSFTSR